MATYSKEFLTGSTNGTPIALTSTNSDAGTVIHTCPASTNKDEVWVYVWNKSTLTVTAFVEFGDTVSPVVENVAPQAGPQVIIPGLLLQNSKIVRGYCSTASTAALFVGGYVNRITA